MRKTTIALFTLLCPFFIFSQNCLNAGLEDGTLSGYATYRGKILDNGQVIIDNPDLNEAQHKVMHISEGFDPIAELNCEVNKMLPVVPEGSGQYTLRLGNANSGAKAERVVLSFKVTPELTFFLLRYAVILNDPNHEPFEQPRFELRILDENGVPFTCGEYQVRAAANIPGFESCSGGWRVRPWTTVGFELQSFLGQEIQIEILTTDCAQGGHAGYAYLDINCQPLEIKLDGYCPDNTRATMSVTAGFVDYLWNTGDKTSSILIEEPLAGTPYQVTVTSATGCTLVLSDTIPELKETPSPNFAPTADLSFCRDTTIWFQPKGEHLNEIYSPNLGIIADSFSLEPNPNPYLFVASDQFGCNLDSTSFFVYQRPPAIEAIIDPIKCFQDSTGKIELNVVSDFPPIQYQWSNGAIGNQLSGLKVGNYEVTIIDNLNCENTASISMIAPEKLEMELKQFPISCYGESDGQLEISPFGGTKPYAIKINELASIEANITQLKAGTYQIIVIDEKGCQIEDKIIFQEPSPVKMNIFTQPSTCFGHLDGKIEVEVEGGIAPYDIFWNNPAYDGFMQMNSMPAGTYFARIKDSRDCTTQQSVTVFQPPFDKDCGTFIPNIFSPNGDGLNDVFTVAGSIRGTIIDQFEIYNRWGELVYQTLSPCIIRDKNCGWAGLVKGKEAPMGTYVYLMSINFLDSSEPVLFTGEVQLIR